MMVDKRKKGRQTILLSGSSDENHGASETIFQASLPLVRTATTHHFTKINHVKARGLTVACPSEWARLKIVRDV